MNERAKTDSNTRNIGEQRRHFTFGAVLNRLSDIIQGTMAAGEIRESIRSNAAFRRRVEGLRHSAVGSPALLTIGNIHGQGVADRARVLMARSYASRSVRFSDGSSGASARPFPIISNARNSTEPSRGDGVSEIESSSRSVARIWHETSRRALALRRMLSNPESPNLSKRIDLIRHRSIFSNSVQQGALDHTNEGANAAAHLIRRSAENEQTRRSTLPLSRMAPPIPGTRRRSSTNFSITLGVLANTTSNSLAPIRDAAARFRYGPSPLAFTQNPVGVSRKWTRKAPYIRNEPSGSDLGPEIRLSHLAQTSPISSTAAMSLTNQAGSLNNKNSERHPARSTAMTGQSPAMMNATNPKAHSISGSNEMPTPFIVNFSPTITFGDGAREDDLDNRILEAFAHCGQDIVRIVNRELQTQRRASF